MSGAARPNRLAQLSAIGLALLLALPAMFTARKAMSAYEDLKDVRFQSERVLKQNVKSKQTLATEQKKLGLLKMDFKPLKGTTSQASAQLQTNIRKVISSAGGTIDTISANAPTETIGSPVRPTALNIRWSVSEEGFGIFLAAMAKPRQNLIITNMSIRRRQGVANQVDVRMTVSSLWAVPRAVDAEDTQ